MNNRGPEVSFCEGQKVCETWLLGAEAQTMHGISLRSGDHSLGRIRSSVGSLGTLEAADMLHLGGKFSKYTQYGCYFVACDGLQPSRHPTQPAGIYSWHVTMFLCVSDSFDFPPPNSMFARGMESQKMAGLRIIKPEWSGRL